MDNHNIKPGTVVKFTADARLRQITSKGRGQTNMNEGTLIGEQLEGIVTQKFGDDAYVVYFKDTNFLGWCYNFELYVKDPLAKPETLNFVKPTK